MKFKIITLVFLLLFMASCGSKKKASRKEAQKKEATVSTEDTSVTPKVEETPKKVYADVKEAYIDRYKAIAMEEMRRYKIPASITLAQGILESNSGRSQLTSRSNNHFGIKCHKGWTGGRTYHDDDEKGECFRVYDHPESSFRDHSLFLAERTRYADLFKLKITDYKGWAKGLKKAGYATDKKYPDKLINLIETYKLYTFDDQVLGKKSKRKFEKENPEPQYHVVEKGETLYGISRKYGLSVDELKSINGLDSNTISIGQKLYLTY